MDRRQFLALTAGVACVPLAPARAVGPADNQLAALLDQIFFEQMERSPQSATARGLDSGSRAGLRAKLDDFSQNARTRQREAAKANLTALEAIDPAGLSPRSLSDFETAVWQARSALEGLDRVTYGNVGSGYRPYVLSQNGGAYLDVPDFLDEQHPLAGRDDIAAYIARVEAYASALDQQTGRFTEDCAAGVIPPAFILTTVVKQLEAQRKLPVAEAIVARSLRRRGEQAGAVEADHAAVARLLTEKITPALDRQIAAVKKILPRAPEKGGAWTLPADTGYYAGALTAATTLRLDPREVHRMGLAQVAELESRMDTLLKGLGLTSGSIAARLNALADRPGGRFPNTDQGRTDLLAMLNKRMEALKPVLPSLFNRLPKADVIVRRVPVTSQDGASNGYYRRPPLDGSRPGSFNINLKDTGDWPVFSLPTITYHEAMPGHHLQIALQQEIPGIPMVRRSGGFAAYSEGWALYAEQLADEAGVYENDPQGKLGYLQAFLFRATRLVVDTGIHHERWPREKAITYLEQTTGHTKARMTRDVDRYFVGPGQACSYKVGHMAITRLRDKAKAALGNRFDLKAFHDAVLGTGAMPLAVLETEIDRYIAAAKS